MDWTEEALVLATRPHGEAGAIATVLTAARGRHAGHIPGGQSSRARAVWQPGNLVHARWGGRVSDQLGSFTAELLDPAAARAMEDAFALDLLLAANIALGAALLPGLVAFEAGVLAELGYGLDLATCAVTGETDDLAHVSPRTGRAVSRSGAGAWAERLFRLPPFMLGRGPATRADIADALKITGHFLAARPFAALHRPLPAARDRLYDRVTNWAAESPESGT